MGLDIIVPEATGWGANAIAYAGEIIPPLSGTLKYLGFFGTNYLGDAVTDRSGTGTIPVKSGTGTVGTYFTRMSSSTHWIMPWGPNNYGSSATIVGFGKSVSGNGLIYSNNPGATQTNSMSLLVSANSGGTRKRALDGQAYKGTSVTANIALASGEDAIQATPEYYALSLSATSLKSYRRRPGLTTETTATTSTSLLPGAGAAYIGYSTATALSAGSIDIGAFAFYAKELSPSEIEQVFDGLHAFCTAVGAV